MRSTALLLQLHNRWTLKVELVPLVFPGRLLRTPFCWRDKRER
jgi:hypothetical protein